MKLHVDEYYKAPDSTHATVVVLEAGSSLRCGDPPRYTSKTVVGLLLQYFAIGLVVGTIGSITEPVFVNYFGMPAGQSSLVKAFSQIVWSCKVGFGVLSDCFPIFGYRRKTWMALGWALCTVCLLIIGFKHHGSPTPIPGALKPPFLKYDDDATSLGAFMAALCGVTTSFYVMAVVAADAMVVELGQREPDAIRGRLQSYTYGIGNIGSATAQILIGTLLNSIKYGGDFSWSISINTYFILLAVIVATMVPVSLFMLKEIKRGAINCPQYLVDFWQVVQNLAVWQAMVFAFIYNFLLSFLPAVNTPEVKYVLAQVDPQTNRWMTAVSACMQCVGLWLASHIFNNFNWRYTLASAMALLFIIGTILDFFTIYDVYRNQWFMMIGGVISAAPDGFLTMIPCMIYLDLAQDGQEGITYGMMTTMSNVAYVFTPFVTAPITKKYAVTEDIPIDSDEYRYRLAVPLIIGYSLSLVACATVVLLPKQKDHLQFLRGYGGKQPIPAAFTVFVCFGSVLVTIVTSIMSVFPSTVCMSFGGGTDC